MYIYIISSIEKMDECFPWLTRYFVRNAVQTAGRRGQSNVPQVPDILPSAVPDTLVCCTEPVFSSDSEYSCDSGGHYLNN